MDLSTLSALVHAPLVIAVLVCVGAPLTAAWVYAMRCCLQQREAEGRQESDPLAAAPLSAATWLLLMVLTGWFGALAYLAATQTRRPVWLRAAA